MRDGNEETTGDINSCTFKKVNSKKDDIKQRGPQHCGLNSGDSPFSVAFAMEKLRPKLAGLWKSVCI